MLQGVQPEIGHPGRFFMPINAEQAAIFFFHELKVVTR
jgi:hypothetical protein